MCGRRLPAARLPPDRSGHRYRGGHCRVVLDDPQAIVEFDAGVAIAVALVPPLCVSGIGLTLGSEMVAVFGRGTVAGLTNQIAEGSFLLFLANLIGITVTSLVVFLLQRYGSFRSCWRNLLVWLGLLRAVEPALVIGIA